MMMSARARANRACSILIAMMHASH
eukprot:SAG31_NODE_15386_length_757_cov_2.109422_1_plen_24_part_10